MGRANARRLIVNADDFGRSPSINQAVIRAHRDGILTTASLMVNGAAAKEAVTLAHDNPGLGVGLHLTLVCGHSALSSSEIPSLVDWRGQFPESAVKAGFTYYFRRSLRNELRREIEAQFKKFHSFGLKLDHVNGHLNLHLHPTIFALLMENAKTWGITACRLTRDPFWLNAQLAGGRRLYRLSHAFIFALLGHKAGFTLRKLGIRHTDRVFGLLQNARVDTRYVLRLLKRLPLGDSELYSHPSLDEFKHEYDALMEPRVRGLADAEQIRLIRYQDL
jgi:chitin disaccharide deacetylase